MCLSERGVLLLSVVIGSPANPGALTQIEAFPVNLTTRFATLIKYLSPFD